MNSELDCLPTSRLSTDLASKKSDCNTLGKLEIGNFETFENGNFGTLRGVSLVYYCTCKSTGVFDFNRFCTYF